MQSAEFRTQNGWWATPTPNYIKGFKSTFYKSERSDPSFCTLHSALSSTNCNLHFLKLYFYNPRAVQTIIRAIAVVICEQKAALALDNCGVAIAVCAVVLDIEKP